MTQLLLRLFVKNHQDTQSPAVREGYGKLAGLTGIVVNALLCAGKLLAGALSGSVSIMADAINNLSDAASSIVTLLGFKLAAKPADDAHPYGHQRVEYLAGLTVAALILLIGAELVKSSIQRILHPEAVAFTVVGAAVLLLSIAAKLWLCLFYRKLGKSIRSEALLASAADSRNDVASTAAVLAAYAFAWFTHIQIDGWAGLLVAVFILWSGVGIAKDTIDPLLGEAPDEALVHAIAQEIRSYDARVLGIHDLIVHDYGPGRRFASVHVELDAREDVLEAHELIDNIERDVTKKLRVELVIHYDPIVTDDAEVNEVRQRVEAIVTEIDPRLSFHDFRMVRGREHSNVIFDLVLPFDLRGQEHALRARIGAALHAENPRYRAVITFDSEAFNDVHTRMEADIPEAGDMPAKKA